MAPLVPRMHLFEIDDQPWFPPYFRRFVQAALTVTWTSRVPVLQRSSPAAHVAAIIPRELGSFPPTDTHARTSKADAPESPIVDDRELLGLRRCREYTFVDFCAGSGGPTPSIERRLNRALARLKKKGEGAGREDGHDDESQQQPLQFVLTDLFPHVAAWEQAAARSPNISFEPESVDASAASEALLARLKSTGSKKGDGGNMKERKKVFRMFNLAFHHFDDELARRILRNTVENSEAFGIFELQSRTVESFLTICLLGIGTLLAFAPTIAWRWRMPSVLLWTYLIPIVPFVVVFDGFVSSLRTRTPDEVEVLLRTCGADADEIAKWEVRSGRERHLWPTGYLDWIVCVKRGA